MDAQSKIAFEKVTELSSALMSSGEYDVYDSRKETFEPSVPAGYAFDETTKLYKCESSGLSYCPKTGGFVGEREGRWWWFDESATIRGVDMSVGFRDTSRTSRDQMFME